MAEIQDVLPGTMSEEIAALERAYEVAKGAREDARQAKDRLDEAKRTLMSIMEAQGIEVYRRQLPTGRIINIKLSDRTDVRFNEKFVKPAVASSAA